MGVEVQDKDGIKTIVFEGKNYDGKLRKVELPLDDMGKICHKMALQYLVMPKTQKNQRLIFNVNLNRPKGTTSRCVLKWGIAAG